MRLITGAGIAGALALTGGAPAVAFTQSASGDDSAAVTTQADPTETDDGGDTAEDSDVADTDDTEAVEPEEAGDSTEDTTDGTTDVGGELGRAHAAAMQVWAQCVADAASGPKTVQVVPPKTACDPKPVAPGRLLQQLGAPDDTESNDDTTSTGDSGETDADEAATRSASGGHGWATSHSRGHHGAGHHGHHG